MVRQGVDVSKLYSGLFVGLAFFALTAMVVKFFAPDVNSSAETASQTVGPYTMSMASDDSVSINATPTESQAVYTATNNLSVTNSCEAGATVTIATASKSSNSLMRAGLDSLAKEIAATTSSSSLVDNSWGFSIDGGLTYKAVPKLGQTAATVYSSENAQTTALAVPVMFGVKFDSTLPSGAYINDVIYTMAPDSACLVYTVNWDLDGGTAAAGATYPTTLAWGETVDLSALTPTREGFVFNGWTNGTSTFTGSETSADVNAGNNKTANVKAEWMVDAYEFRYTGAAQTWTAPVTGRYKIELWGAGVNQRTYDDGGSYVSGEISLNRDAILHVYVGAFGIGHGVLSNGVVYTLDGQYDPDGLTENYSYSYSQACTGYCYGAPFNGGGRGGGANGWAGGGATDIRVVDGAWNNADSLRSRIMVASGAGGTSSGNGSPSKAIAAGGLSGYDGTKNRCENGTSSYCYAGKGGTQTAGGSGNKNGSFGAGGDGGLGGYNSSGYAYPWNGGAGGAGWYGGGSGQGDTCCGSGGSGGSGSSYISGHAGAVGVTSTTSSSPKSGCSTGTTNIECSITPYVNSATNSGYKFTNTVMIDGAGYAWANTKGSQQQMPNPYSGGYYDLGGGNIKNGFAKITYLGN